MRGVLSRANYTLCMEPVVICAQVKRTELLSGSRSGLYANYRLGQTLSSRIRNTPPAAQWSANRQKQIDRPDRKSSVKTDVTIMKYSCIVK